MSRGSITATLALLGSVVIALIVVARCGPSSPSPSATVTSAPSTQESTTSPGAATNPAESSVGLVPDQNCLVKVAPGPGDAPPAGGGDLIDTSDFGAGRWRLCLLAPVGLALEETALCEWNADRTVVTQVSGHPHSVGSTDVDGYVSFVPPAAGVSLADPQWDRIVSYDREGRPMSFETDEGHVTGRAGFELAQNADPELGIVVGAPPGIAGTIAWVCGDPPAA